MAKLLLGIQGVVTFINNILVAGSNRTELNEMLKRVHVCGLTVKKRKMYIFCKTSNVFHLIDKTGLYRKPDLVDVIRKARRQLIASSSK